MILQARATSPAWAPNSATLQARMGSNLACLRARALMGMLSRLPCRGELLPHLAVSVPTPSLGPNPRRWGWCTFRL